MAKINPHINFNGNAEEAFTFYKSVFGGEFGKIIRFKEIASEEFPVPENEADKLMHIALHFGQNILMANDVPEFMGRVNENENRSKIYITAESKDEAFISSMDCQKELMSKCLLQKIQEDLILLCFEISMELSGW
jgi:PhnB protein